MNTAVASTKKSAEEGCPNEGFCIRQKHFKKITKAVLSNNAFPAEIARLIAEYAYECPSWGMFFFQGQVPDDVWMLRRRSPYPPMETLTGKCRDTFFRPLRWSMQVKWEDPTTVAPTKHPAKESTNAEQGLPTWLVVDCTTDPRALIPRDEYGQSDASDSDGSEKEDTTKENDDGYATKHIPEVEIDKLDVDLVLFDGDDRSRPLNISRTTHTKTSHTFEVMLPPGANYSTYTLRVNHHSMAQFTIVI